MIGEVYLGHDKPARRKFLILDQNRQNFQQENIIISKLISRCSSLLFEQPRTFSDHFRKPCFHTFPLTYFFGSKSTSAIIKSASAITKSISQNVILANVKMQLILLKFMHQRVGWARYRKNQLSNVICLY